MPSNGLGPPEYLIVHSPQRIRIEPEDEVLVKKVFSQRRVDSHNGIVLQVNRNKKPLQNKMLFLHQFRYTHSKVTAEVCVKTQYYLRLCPPETTALGSKPGVRHCFLTAVPWMCWLPVDSARSGLKTSIPIINLKSCCTLFNSELFTVVYVSYNYLIILSVKEINFFPVFKNLVRFSKLTIKMVNICKNNIFLQNLKL